jgi:glycogen operon protein
MGDEIGVGLPHPLGATLRDGGVNFSVFSRNATAVELLLFDGIGALRPSRVIDLHPQRNRTFYYWHAFVPGLRSGQLYGYRVHGPYAPDRGFRFDGAKLLVDPYARAVAIPETYSRKGSARGGDNSATAMRSVVADLSVYDWEGDRPLQRPLSGGITYELHVGGFTRHPSSGVPEAHRGTYAGVIEKVPYLASLGVTTVELLPVQQFDAQDAFGGRPNYWGYSPVAFFAPHRGYCVGQGPLAPLDEFRDLVKALHRAGIEVILDVVFNHTAEGPEEGPDTGPTLAYRGLENRAYYILDEGGRLANFTGCGNTVNGNHSIVRRMITDCLHFWVRELHVDGFRFDLASVLSRDEMGNVLDNPPILWEIESDPELAGTKIIAEAWDAAGLYQVGSFVGHRWSEWNGRFRDDVRRWVKSDGGLVGRIASGLVGSPELFRERQRDPHRSVNFITCHDGFTLHDLVSYAGKHNEANGEDNRDGADQNHSWNCGAEGPTSDPAVLALRQRQMKNCFALLLLAQGTPMILMGDEVGRTQKGNNNAYCQDNALSWMDWRDLERHGELREFVRRLIGWRRRIGLFVRDRSWAEATIDGPPLLTWHGVTLDHPDWTADSRTLAFTVSDGRAGGEALHVMLNAYWEPMMFEVPASGANGAGWRRILDTARPSPDDCATDQQSAPHHEGQSYWVDRRSVVALYRKG